MSNKRVIITQSTEETQKFGEMFSKTLRGGIVTLYGDLGSGKTTFVQGLAKGLRIKRRIISPTFVIVRTYKIESKNFYHIDLYRAESKNDIEGLGIREIMNNPQSVVVIEWAQKLEDLLPKKRIDIYFEYVDENRRKITYESRY